MEIVEKILKQIDDNRDCKWNILVETSLNVLNDRVNKLQSAVLVIQEHLSTPITQ